MADKDNFAISAVIIVAVILAICAYFWSEDRGWIAQSNQGSVYFPENGWPVGGFATCRALEPPNGVVQLDCRVGSGAATPPQEMRVKFWGDVGKTSSTFRCQRTSDFIACRLPSNQ